LQAAWTRSVIGCAAALSARTTRRSGILFVKPGVAIIFGRVPLKQPLADDFINADFKGSNLMAKAYWISCYREITDPLKLTAYAKLAGPAIEAGGGRVLARATAVQAYEAGQRERTVLIEFSSVEQAVATHDSPEYQSALAALDGGAVRDLRIVPGA
jgi:uncharacterized protein (DUF1330 family)